MPTFDELIASRKQQYLDELLDFLRIPSISAETEHIPDVAAAGQWTADRLQAAGMENVQVYPTGGHPVVYGDWLHAPTGQPTIMIYGHFDVQPVDPLELWETPPFEPTIRDGRIYARGASDDKGGLLGPIQAVDALLEAEGALPVNVKFLIEGQEEIGSPQLGGWIKSHTELLACDLVLNADMGQFSETQPALLTGLRGICALQIDLKGSDHDLHSGGYGGAVQNPLHAMAALIATMHDDQGRITVDGFFDDVPPLTDDVREQVAAVPWDEASYAKDSGNAGLFGDPDYTPIERAWVRPTLEVNGMWGGFQGDGTKTVIPTDAHAKITCRLVPNQDPAKIAKLIEAHVVKHVQPGVTATVDIFPTHGMPYELPADHPDNAAAAEVLRELYGVEPLYQRTGGSIPICTELREALGANSVAFSFGLPDEFIHAPNEFYRLESFYRSHVAYGMVLKKLAK